MQGEPPGGFWISWEDMDRITAQGDSFAFSGFVGFPALPFDIFNQASPKSNTAWLQVAKDYVMRGLLVCFVVSLFFLVGLMFSRRRFGLPLIAILAIGGGSASALEFDLFPPAKTYQAIHFDCLPVAAASHSIAKKEEDLRPVIHVETMRGCAPCMKCKQDAKSPALAGFRFVFRERTEVEGGAPWVSWQGRSGKHAFHGWYGPDFFLKVYSKSTHIEGRCQSPIAPNSNAACFGGRCLGCRR